MRGKIFLSFIVISLLLCDAKLIVTLVNSHRENSRLLRRINLLLEKNNEVKNEFVLKQDHMRKMLTDRNFMNQVVRQKEGYIKPKEKLFKFED
ncbi:MAG: hypothetical protein LBI81_02060 [Puniceicoccales bacterium]|jgi:cell division protein FtsB|nr:hypothetical protein [Puniceicoccales bacterium]